MSGSTRPAEWHCAGYRFSLNRPLLMGIVNTTPDSFSDGGRYATPAAAIAHARQLVEEGADILDIGGESSRPGADSVPEEEELRRVLPVIDGLAHLGVPLSIDTVKPAVMRAAVAHGVAIINDINALRAPGALQAAASGNSGVVLMHMQGSPATMQLDPQYEDVVSEVTTFLAGRLATARAAGISATRLAVDPGFGFGKLLHHNIALLRELPSLSALGHPVLVGISRKSMLKGMSRQDPDKRVAASVTAALLAVQRGAAIVRIHDVATTRAALDLLAAVSAPDASARTA